MTAILLTNAVILVGMIVLLWLYSLRIRDVSFIDAFWPFGMVVLAVATFVHSEGSPGRKLLLTGLTALWGLRLSIHLFRRWRRDGEDPRYKKIVGHTMEKRGWSFAQVSLIQVFGLQAVLLYIVCLPAVLGQIPGTPYDVGILGWIGAAAALAGIAFETIGDAQLARHRADPAMKGKVLDTGLWRYTRHPNYFGDALTWWGLWLIAAETRYWWAAIAGPILITWLLTRLSGVPMLERGLKKTRPGYEDYVRRTSGLFPWWPKG